jgi:hypothetical protein
MVSVPGKSKHVCYHTKYFENKIELENILILISCIYLYYYDVYVVEWNGNKRHFYNYESFLNLRDLGLMQLKIKNHLLIYAAFIAQHGGRLRGTELNVRRK